MDSFSFVANNGAVDSEPATVRVLVQPSPSDTTPPTVLKTDPAAGETGVPVIHRGLGPGVYLPAVTATFSEAVDSETVVSTTFTVDGITGTVVYDGASQTATFYPSAPLETSTTYTARLNTGVTDNSGNPLPSEYAWSFETVGDVAIKVTLPPEHDYLDCGTVSVGTFAYRVVSISSVGTSDLSMGAIGLSGADAAQFAVENDTCSGRILGPAEACMLRVVFSPTSEGEKTATLSIPSGVR